MNCRSRGNLLPLMATFHCLGGVRVTFLQSDRQEEIELLQCGLKGRTRMNEAFDQTWRALSEDILTEVNQWRAAHPKATFQELEQALHERLSRLEAQALQEAAQDRSDSDWSQTPERDHPHCPSCGTPLLARGQHVRHEASTGRARCAAAQKLRHLPPMWAGAFPPSMRDERSCQEA